MDIKKYFFDDSYEIISGNRIEECEDGEWVNIEDLKFGECDGCKYLDRRCCCLPPGNHCIRRAEDYYTKED